MADYIISGSSVSTGSVQRLEVGDVIPHAAELYDLGTAEKPFRDLHVSSGSIKMYAGSAEIARIQVSDDDEFEFFSTKGLSASQKKTFTKAQIRSNATPGKFKGGNIGSSDVAIGKFFKAGIGIDTPINQKLHVMGGGDAQIRISSNETDDASKTGGIIASQYNSDTETEGFMLLQGFSNQTTNRIDIGGGHSGINAAEEIKFHTAANSSTRTGTERLVITNAGNIGIGVAAPSSKLHIIGSSSSGASTPVHIVGGTGSSAGGLKIGAYNGSFGGIWSGAVTPATSNYALVANDTRTVLNATSDIAFYISDSTNNFYMNSTGVGIGNTSPARKLDVSGTGRFTGTLTTAAINTSGDLNVGSGDFFVDDSTGKVGIGTTSPGAELEIKGIARDTELFVIERFNDSQNFLEFKDVSNDPSLEIFKGNGTTFFKINETGNVGIGTTTPDTNLHIHKASAGSISSKSFAQLTIENDSHTALQFLSPNGVNNIIYFGDVDDADAGYIAYVHSTDALHFNVATADRLVINSSGNVGIGNSTPAHKLDVTGDGRFTTNLTVGGNITGSSNLKIAGEIELFNTATSLDPFQYNLYSKGNIQLQRGATINFDNNDYRHGYIKLDGGNPFNLNIYGYYGVKIGSQSTDSIAIATGGGSVAFNSEIRMANGKHISGSSTSTGSFGKLLGDASDLTNLPASYAVANSSNNRVLTSIDSSNGNAEANLVFDGTNLGIGITDPNSYYTQYNNFVVGETGNHAGMTIRSGTTHNGTIAFADGTSGVSRYESEIGYNHNANFAFINTGGNHRVKISATVAEFPTANYKISGSASSTGSFGDIQSARGIRIGLGGGDYGSAQRSIYTKFSSHNTARIESVSGVPSIELVRSSEEKYYWQHETSGLNHKYHSGGSYPSWMFVSNALNVGIGTTNPSAKLHIYGGDWNTQLTIQNDNANNNGIRFMEDGGAINGYVYGRDTGIISFLNPDGNYAYRHTHSTSHGWYLDSSQLMALTTTGLGIGNTSPSHKLDVTGNGRITGNLIVGGTITAQKIITNVVSQSISFATGSNIFGDEQTDKHQFTGSLNVSGSITLNGSSVTSGGGASGVTISNNAANRVLTGDGTNAVANTDLTWNGTKLTLNSYEINAPGDLTLNNGSEDANTIINGHGGNGTFTVGESKSHFMGSNLGIGTTSPEASLDVNTTITGASGTNYGLIIRGSEVSGTNLEAGDGIGLKFEIPIDTATSNFGASIEVEKGSNLDSNSESVMKFYTSANNETKILALKLNQAGNVCLEPTKELYFDGGGNTYIYESSNDVLDVYVGAANALKISPTEIQVPRYLTHMGDGNNYLDFGTDTLTFVNDGGDTLQLLSNHDVIVKQGNLGIGTTSPDVPLSFGVTSTNSQVLKLRQNSNSKTGFGITANYGVRVFAPDDAGATNQMFEVGTVPSTASTTFTPKITALYNGNVGIGTTTPDTNLHIHKASAGTVVSDANAQLTIENNDHASLQFLTPNNKQQQILFGDPDDIDIGYINYNHNTNKLAFAVAAGVRMTIASGGQVGIGNASPAEKLHVTGTVRADTDGEAFQVHSASGTRYQYQLQNILAFENAGGVIRTAGSTALSLQTNSTTAITIDTSQNVGIGTVTPARLLHLAAASPSIMWEDTDVSGLKHQIIAGGNAGLEISVDINNTTTGYFRVDVGGSEKMRLTEAGNVGIGTNNPNSDLHVHKDVGDARITIDSATNSDAQLKFANGGGNSWSIFSDGSATNDPLIFYDYASSTSMMTLKNGKVGIGGDPDQKLDVSAGHILIDNGYYVIGRNNSGSQKRLIGFDGTTCRINDEDSNTLIGAAGTTVTIGGNISVTGQLTALSKSFLINHPTKEGKKLQYASLEGPENGVYVRGKIEGDVIELPDYWTGLVHDDSITVNLTPIGKYQHLFVKEIKDNKVFIECFGSSEIKCFYTIYGERKDIEKLEVEF